MPAQQYHVLPRTSDDTERDSSPHQRLLPNVSSGLRRLPNSCAITIYPVLTLRIISSILALTAFIIFVLDGGAAFIASAIFLALLLIFNILMIIHHSVSHIFKVTIELRQNEWRNELGVQKKPKISSFADIVLIAGLALCLIIGNAAKDRYWSGAWKAAVVVGWFVVFLQAILVVPSLDQKSLTITAKLNDLDGKFRPDSKLPENSTSLGVADTGAARRRTPEAELPRQQAAEDIV